MKTATMNTNTASPSFLDIFAAPGSFFSNLLSAENKTNSWIALLLLIAITSGGTWYFFSGMSNEWIVDQQMLHVAIETPSEEKEVKAFLMETAQYSGALGAIFNAIFYMVLISIFAGYFKLLAGKAADKDKPSKTYGDWFSFSVWTQMPNVVYTFGLLALLFTASTPQVPLSLVNYASVNQLFLNLPIGHNFYDVAETINLFFIWCISLSTIGLMRWTTLSVGKATAISALPYVLVFGIWAAVSM